MESMTAIPSRSAEQRVRWIMFGHFGFQDRAVGNVRRVGDDEVNAAVEVGQQTRFRHIGAGQFDIGACEISVRVFQRMFGIVNGDDARVGPVLRQRERQRTGTGAQIDDQRMFR